MTSNSDFPVVFENVGKTFSTPKGAFRALDGISLSIPSGSIFGIIGRSGAGKSTLVRLVNRLERPSSGRVLVNGTDVGTLNERQLNALRRRTGMIFQHFNLLSSRTVGGNIALPLRAAGMDRKLIGRRVTDVLDLVGLADKREAYVAELSGGQKQRVGIARALVHEPDILLCDEATSALDPETTQSILALLSEINRRLGLTILLITHEMAVIREICDQVAVFEGGELVEKGEVWRVFGAPEHEATRALLRPLVHDLPEGLARRLQKTPPDAPYRTILSLGFTGEDREDPSLSQLAGHLGDDVRLLHGGLDRIQDRAQGRLIVSTRIEPHQLEEVLGKIHVLTPNTEIVGYVAG